MASITGIGMGGGVPATALGYNSITATAAAPVNATTVISTLTIPANKLSGAKGLLSIDLFATGSATTPWDFIVKLGAGGTTLTTIVQPINFRHLEVLITAPDDTHKNIYWFSECTSAVGTCGESLNISEATLFSSGFVIEISCVMGNGDTLAAGTAIVNIQNGV